MTVFLCFLRAPCDDGSGGHGGHAESLAWLDAYDIEKNIWTTDLPNGPTPRDHTGGGILDGRLCVAGGRDGGDPKYQKKPVRETDCYNFDTGMWSVEKKMPVGRAGSAYGVTCGGMLAVAGGEGFGKAFDQVHFFNGKRWFWGPKLQRARHGSALAIHSCECGQISIASGSGGQGGGPELRTVETLFNVGQTESCR